MALQPRQYQDLIVSELKGGESLRATIEALWDRFSRYHRNPDLQYLKTKLAAINFLLGNLEEEASEPVEGDLAGRETTRKSILLALRYQLLDELKASRRGRAPVVGKLLTTAICEAAPGFPDPNAQTYRGDPRDLTPPVIP